MYLIVDAHQDLAWNMLTFGRDYTQSAHETRKREAGGLPVKVNGDSILGWPEFQKGNVGIIFSTLFVSPARRALAGEWDNQTYKTFDEAHERYKSQAEAYHRLADQQPDKFHLLFNRKDVEAHLALWKQPAPENGRPVGLIILMEGAEGVRSPSELKEWWELGTRIIGPAWAGTRFCGGTREPGPLTEDGFALLKGMSEIGFTLDISHMDRQAVYQALDTYEGNIIASHANPLAMLKGSTSNRFLADDVIARLVERDGIIGIIPTNQFMKFGWTMDTPRNFCSLETIADHIDYVCQIAGNTRHVAWGTDFDGGFGLHHIPLEMDTIADLQKVAPILSARGYSEADIEGIFGGNWINFLMRGMPA
jgi:membrane dipeptidase